MKCTYASIGRTLLVFFFAFISLLALANASGNSVSVCSPKSREPTFASNGVLKQLRSRSAGNFSSHSVNFFDPFGDLTEVDTTSFFSSDNERKAFYDFSEANIQESKVAEWYAEWSKAYLETPASAMTFEWEDFVSGVGNHPNFICTLAFGMCSGAPSIHELEQEFPGYPHYVRRIYFVTQMYTLLHARAKTIGEGYQKAQLFIVDHIAEIVHNMQLEPDASKAALCALIHQIIKTGISLTISAIEAIGKAVAGVDTSQIPALQKVLEAGLDAGKSAETIQKAADEIQRLHAHAGKILEITKAVQGAVKFAVGASQNGKAAVPLMVGMALQQQYEARIPELIEHCSNKSTEKAFAGCAKMVSEFGMVNDFFSIGQFADLYSGILGYIKTPKGNPQAEYRPNPWDNLYLSAGQDGDSMCAKFEGGLQVNSEHNIQELKYGLSNKFAQMRDVLTGAFERYYEGKTAAFPGSMSETASLLAETQWAGFDSALYNMHMTTKWQNHFELQMSMQAASVMGAHDFSHMVCTTSKDAPALCAKAAASGPCGDKYKNCIHSVICPEPSNPEIICRAQKWYSSPKGGSHMTKFPSADKWEPLMGNRYGLTQRKVLSSAWDYFKVYRNDFQSLDATWGTKSNQIVNQAGGFHLPVCFKDGLDVTSDNFPVSCGDWRSSDTEIFMASSFMGPNGQLFNSDNDLITRVLPDVVDKTSKTPLARYLNFCALNIRWPNMDDHDAPIPLFKMHRGADGECGMISASTQSMSEEAANEWFCSAGYGAKAHSVFKRERGHITVTPADMRWSHQKICTKGSRKTGLRLPKPKTNGTMPVRFANTTTPVVSEDQEAEIENIVLDVVAENAAEDAVEAEVEASEDAQDDNEEQTPEVAQE